MRRTTAGAAMPVQCPVHAWCMLIRMQSVMAWSYHSITATTAYEVSRSSHGTSITVSVNYRRLHPSLPQLTRNTINISYSSFSHVLFRPQGTQNSSVDIAIRLRARMLGNRDCICGWVKFIIFQIVQTDCEAQTASYLLGICGYTVWGKAAGAWSWPLICIGRIKQNVLPCKFSGLPSSAASFRARRRVELYGFFFRAGNIKNALSLGFWILPGVVILWLARSVSRLLVCPIFRVPWVTLGPWRQDTTLTTTEVLNHNKSNSYTFNLI